MKILLIAGGWSSERDISLKGAKNIETALRELGHEVTLFDLLHEFNHLLEKAGKHDFAFINLHGSPGEDGLVQAMLDSIACPYQGSGPAGSFLALNKAAAKQIYRRNGIPTPDWEFLPLPPDKNWRPRLPYPLFVKSNTGGSSLRLGKVENDEQLFAALTEIFAAGEEALLETAIMGQDLTCGILGNTPLPPVLIIPLQGKFFDFKSKYAENGSKEVCPAPIADNLTQKIQTLSAKAHHALGLRGVSRSDFILTADNDIWMLETNTLPGMTSASLLPKEAMAIGLSFNQMLETMIQNALKRHTGIE